MIALNPGYAATIETSTEPLTHGNNFFCTGEIMARKPTTSVAEPSLTADQIRQGIDRLNRRISELEEFDPSKVGERWAPETKAIEASIDDTLSRIFGHETPRYFRYSGATNLDKGPLIMGGGDDPLFKVRGWLNDGRAKALALLRQAVKSLEEDLTELPAALPAMISRKDPESDEVFVVHGHDEKAKAEVANVIERAGLTAVILHQQPNGGQTIIEKFEKHGGAVGFAVVIATPDDVGGISSTTLRPRARQNVIGEMFWFAGRLGRNRVCALVKGEIEMPSDIAGVGYTPMHDHGGWKSKLLQELDAAGYKNLDWKKALA